MKINIMKRSLFFEILIGLLILLFTYTGFSKLIQHERFHFALLQSPLIQYGAGFITWIIPSIELIIVLLLFFPKTRLPGLYASLCLLILFTQYLLYMIMFTEKLPCQCGGVISNMSWKTHVFFNLFFIVVSITAISVYRKILRNQAKPKTCINE